MSQRYQQPSYGYTPNVDIDSNYCPIIEDDFYNHYNAQSYSTQVPRGLRQSSTIDPQDLYTNNGGYVDQYNPVRESRHDSFGSSPGTGSDDFHVSSSTPKKRR